MRYKWTDITPGCDAVILPEISKGVACIIYLNECANGGNGSIEIEYVDKERIIRLNEEVRGNSREFFDLLPDWFQGEWFYCDNTIENEDFFQEWVDAYFSADFIVGRDGNIDDELEFLVKWARGDEV